MATISGRVVDASGRGIAGARVMVTAAPGPVPDMAMLTDADGGFVIGAARPGRYTIAATTDAAAGEHSVTVATDPIRGVELRLPG
jgi:protocatechuate 3,4-dioxygenase beta subunit